MSAAILCYHRVVTRDQDPSQLCVRPERFAEQLEVLVRDRRPVRLADLVAQGGGERAVAVTFDDGYADFLDSALPALEAREIPVTCFIATGGSEWFWWDEVDRLLPGAADPPPRLELDGDVWPTASETDRWVALHALHRRLRRRSPEEIASDLAAVRAWAGVEKPSAGSRSDGEDRTLTVDELRALAAHPLVDIGAHTRRHPCLAAQPLEVQRAEVEGSRDDLEEWLGAAPAGFAYPFGVAGEDYDAATRGLVAALGFEYALGGYGAVPDAPDPFELPRHLVPDCAGRDFAAWLRRRS